MSVGEGTIIGVRVGVRVGGSSVAVGITVGIGVDVDVGVGSDMSEHPSANKATECIIRINNARRRCAINRCL